MKTPSPATLNTQLPLHTWSGILTSLLLLICFLAGSLSVYRDTLNRWATPPQTAPPYDPAQTAALIRATLAAHPEAARELTLHLHDHESAPLSWIDAHQQKHHAWLDADGQLHSRAVRDTPLGDLANRLHQTAGIPGTLGHEDIGLLLMGLVAILYSHPPKVSDKARRRRQYAVVRRGDATQYEAFGGWLYTLALSSGLILYLPTLAANFLALRADKSRRRAWLDSHNLLGITSLPFHLIIAATTVVFAFHDLIYDGMDTLLPDPLRMGEFQPARPDGAPVPPDLTRLKLPEELQTLAQKHRADYRADSITYRNLDRPALASAYQHGSVGGMRSAIHIANPYDGRERYTNLATDPYTTISDSYFHLHFGDYGGSIVRAAYFLLGIMGAALFYTGNLLWLDKRPPRRDKTAAALPASRQAAHIMAALTLGISWGCIAGTAAAFLAARWLHPLPLAPQTTLTSAYYTTFLAAIAYSQWQGAGSSAVPLIRLCAWLTLAIPATTALGALGLPPLFARSDTLGVDATALALGLALHHTARLTAKRLALAPPHSVWHRAPNQNPGL